MVNKKYTQSKEEKIKMLRTAILIHSYLYYELDDPVMTDEHWTSIAQELKNLGHIEIGYEDEQFKNWEGITGHHLKFSDDIIRKALEVRNMWEQWHK